MSQADIRRQRKVVEKEIARVQRMLDAAKAELSALQGECDHPKMQQYSAQGERGNYCPDCGYQD